MKLRKVRLRYAPGMPQGIAHEVELDERLTFIVGPNASGKSTLARTIRHSLWDQKQPASIDANVEAVDASGQTYVVELHSGRPVPHALHRGSAHAAPLYKLGLGELLKSTNRADAEFAQRLQAELYGGVPVHEIRQEIQKDKRESRTQRRGLAKAQEDVRNANRRSRTFEGKETRLNALHSDVLKAKQAKQSVHALQCLQDAKAEANQLLRVNAQLKELPEGLDRLKEDDLDTLRTLEAERVAARGQYEVKQREVSVLETQLHQLDEAWKTLSQEALDDGKSTWDALQAAITTQNDCEAKRILEEERLHVAQAKIFHRALKEPIPSDTKDALRETLRELQQREAQRTALQQRYDSIGVSSSWESKDADTIQRKINGLNEWLRTPSADHILKGHGLIGIVTICCLLAAILCGILLSNIASTVDDSSLAVGVLIGLAVVLSCLLSAWYWLEKRTAAKSSREEQLKLQEEVTRLGAEVSDWTQPMVLDELERSQRALRELKIDEQAKSAKHGIQRELDHVEEALNTLRQRWNQRTDEIGIRAEVLSLELAEIFARTEKWINAEANVAKARASLEAARLTVARLQDQWEQWLERHALVEHAKQQGANALLSLAQVRIREARRLSQDLKNQQENLLREKQEVTKSKEQFERFQARVEPWGKSETILENALEQWEERQGLLSEQRQVQTDWMRALAALEEMLNDLNDLPCIQNMGGLTAPVEPATLATLSADVLEDAKERLERSAATYEELLQERTALQTEIDTARERHDIENAYARLQVAEAQSSAQAQKRARAALDERMLDWSIESVSEDSAFDAGVQTLTQANNWLRTFTHGTYELRVNADGKLMGYSVKEQQERDLVELSDATRVQTLLAARLSAIHDAEAGGPQLPLVLDEVFSTTDPYRFEAIAHALSALAHNGRQIIYLTADPSEWYRWKMLQESAPTITQAKVHHILAESIPQGSPIEIPVVQRVEKPTGDDPQEWAMALNIGAPSMWTTSHRWPLL